jgi:hypothetical protein
MTDVVWSVNILLGIGLIAVAWIIYYTLTLDNRENVSIQSKEDKENH